MTGTVLGGTFTLAGREVRRMGYGAMQLAGPGVFGAPPDPAEAVAVLRAAIDAGVNHIDTSDYYGPHVVNRLIREALHPYPADLVIVTKVGARRGPGGEWLPATSRAELTQAVHDNLRHLGLDTLDLVNLRSMLGMAGPVEGPLDEGLECLADLQRQGLVRHIGLSNVTARQVADGAAICTIACVQNHFNLVHQTDGDMVDRLAAQGAAYVPFFPLGGFSPLQSEVLSAVAAELGASPLQVALGWLLQRSPNLLLIPGTSRRAHLAENLAAADLVLPPEALARLNAIAAG